MNKQLQVNSEEDLQRRVEMLEAEQKRVTAQLEAVTHKLAELDQGQIGILERMTKSQEASIGLDKELLSLLKGIANADGIERIS